MCRVRKGVDSGGYPLVSRLATESERMELCDVSRHTAREAMRELQSRGLVVRRPGIGTRVVSKQTRRAFAHALSSIEDVHQFATRTRLIDVSVEDVVADGPLAGRGDFRHGQKLLRAEALRVPVDNPESPPL